MDTKGVRDPSEAEADVDAEAPVEETGLHIDGFTKHDQKDMRRMGKQQELMRNFRRVSAFSFTVVLTATWEYLLM